MENQDINLNQYQTQTITKSEASEVSRTFLLNVYNWMTMGLVITGLIAYAVSTVITEEFLARNIFLFYGLLIFQLLIVVGLSFAINKIPAIVAIGAFFFYSALTGLTFSVLFLVYTSASIASTFFVCAAMFGSVSVFGYITKMDLSKIGAFAFMGLIGLIIASVVNMFLQNEILYWIISYVGVLIFVGLTAWDTQKIKRMAQSIDGKSEAGKKAAIMGALNLYLDFINMFLFLLRIMGSRR
jgi:FtsH-binding integral membrane protein